MGKNIDGEETFNISPGSATYPSYSYSTDPNSGLYSIAEDKIGFATNGTNRLSVENDIIDAEVKVDVPLGTNAAKALTFNETYLPAAEEFTIRGAFTGFANQGYLQYVAELSRLIAFSRDDLYYSSDGITWTAATFSPTSVTITYRFGYNAVDNVMIMASTNVDGVLTSTDGGVTWTETGSAFGTGTVRAIDYSPELNLWVAVGSSNQGYSSTDGVTWTARTMPLASNADYDDVLWISNLGLFIACSAGATTGIVTSPDGITWTSRTPATSQAFSRVAYHESSGEVFVSPSSGSDLELQVSSDGITWTDRTTPVLGNVYSDGKLLFICPYTSSTILQVSLDNGATFRTYETNIDDAVFSVATLPGTRLVAVGDGNTLTNVSTVELNNPGLYIDIDGLHTSAETYFPNFGGIVTSALTVNGIGNFVQGTWTPTISTLLNVTSTSNAAGFYLRIGNFVFCLMTIDVDPSASDPTEFGFYFTLPLTIAANNQLAGVAVRQNNPANQISISNDTINTALGRLQGIITSASNQSYCLVFMYRCSI